MDGKLRNMTAIYLTQNGKMLMLYRVGSRVVSPSWCGIGGHFEKDELNDAKATKEALEDAKLEITEENADRIGCIVGSGIGGIGTIEKEHEKLLEKGAKRVSPLLIPMIIGNMASGNVSIHFGLKGKSTCIVTACASGTNSIGEAFRSIKYGEADAMESDPGCSHSGPGYGCADGECLGIYPVHLSGDHPAPCLEGS